MNTQRIDDSYIDKTNMWTEKLFPHQSINIVTCQKTLSAHHWYIMVNVNVNGLGKQ